MQSRPGDSGEVVVFVVQADVVGDDIQGAVVRVSLWRCDLVFFGLGVIFLLLLLLLLLLDRLRSSVLYHREEIMLCDEMSRAGVQRPRQERAQQEI